MVVFLANAAGSSASFLAGAASSPLNEWKLSKPIRVRLSNARANCVQPLTPAASPM
jgi:hypothetical protein